jgi:hypothetical protein
MAELTAVPKSEWRAFFDRVSKGMVGKRAEIEVASLDLGDQIAAEWIPLLGITYDTRDDALDVVLDRSNHVIQHPREIFVEEGTEGVASVAVTDGNGAHQLIRLKRPLALPATAESR